MGNQRDMFADGRLYGRRTWENNRASSFAKPIATDKSIKHYIAGQTVVGALLIVCSCSIVLAKVLALLTGKTLTMLLGDGVVSVMTSMRFALVWLAANSYDLWWPLLCGVLVTAFTYGIMYFDSDVPGLVPPSPFISNKYQRFQRRQRTSHLNYLVSIVAGVTVFGLLCVSNSHQQ